MTSLSLLLHRHIFLIFALLSICISQIESLRSPNSSVTAIFVFGDSTVDPGNNNFIGTAFKSNFPPYGRDFINQTPTGRFCNGRLATDFIASYVGVKEYVPPYLDATLSLSELMTGVSFASAGSGYDPLTPQLTGVIPILKQLEYFKEYKRKIETVIGRKNTENHIKKAVFILSSGTNDFVLNYFGLPIRRKSFSIRNYQIFLIQCFRQFIQGLWDEGARKFTVSGLPPMGCLPVVITLNSQNAFLHRDCIDTFSSVARDYNSMLQNELLAIRHNIGNRGGRIYYIDIYRPLADITQRHDKYGIEEWRNGCCGTGLLEASFLCNPKSYACPDASKYVYWDSIHPTEHTYYLVFLTLRPTIDHFLSDS